MFSNTGSVEEMTVFSVEKHRSNPSIHTFHFSDLATHFALVYPQPDRSELSRYPRQNLLQVHRIPAPRPTDHLSSPGPD